MPRTWQQTAHEWVSNRVYGLALPKIVVSNRLTRDQGTSGMNIMDVPLCKVISGGVNNWALRQVAHGRTVQWENFRSRQEAIFCGVLMRALRSDQAEQEGTDFVTVLNAFQKKLYPASDLQDWTARYNAIKKLAEDVVKEFRKKAPVQANQTLLTRLQKLESENARLKGQASGSSRPTPKASPSGAKTSQRKGGPKHVVVPVSTPPHEDAPEEELRMTTRQPILGRHRTFRTSFHHRMKNTSQTQDRLQQMIHTNSTFRSPVSHCFLRVQFGQSHSTRG